ncbi:beta-lactamase family protein [Homoserinimonas aerilata]|uniref:Beta-lactamase family protein n=1 Tax=Homoserinimonas aerilata TaxID=1162970 RepID=A0A542YHG2_9MICO|nr:MBL fold metallo-hydrolase [Homoserinimonas aerilata]TQL47539.1 beta-lactamase family protein [Homoserinimonas aerilata]
MLITKHEHACLVIEKNGEHLVIDPGNFTTPLGGLSSVVGVVITHEHPDHWTPEHLARLLDLSPDARIYGPAGVVAAASDFEVTEVSEGDRVAAGGFTLEFFGSTHAVIHSSIPVIDNVGVLVDETLYYPGDSFTVPTVPVNTLAVPAGAPWLKLSEAMDFVTAIAPQHAFPTHQMVLSKIGQGMVNGRLGAMTQAGGGEFHALEPGDTLEV